MKNKENHNIFGPIFAYRDNRENLTFFLMDPSELFLFQGLSHEEVSYFLMMSETEYVKANKVIMREGDPSNDCAYFINSGSVSVIRGGIEIAVLSAGGLFGELALITQEPRGATIQTKENCELLVLHRDEFLLLAKKTGRERELREMILSRIQENFQR